MHHLFFAMLLSPGRQHRSCAIRAQRGSDSSNACGVSASDSLEWRVSYVRLNGECHVSVTRTQKGFLTSSVTFPGQHIIWVGTLFSPTVHESLANIAAKFRTTVCLKAVLSTEISPSISLSPKPSSSRAWHPLSPRTITHASCVDVGDEFL